MGGPGDDPSSRQEAPRRNDVGQEPGACSLVFAGRSSFPALGWQLGIRAECGAGARLTATEQEGPMPESTKARALGTCRKGSINPGIKAGAGAGWLRNLGQAHFLL